MTSKKRFFGVTLLFGLTALLSACVQTESTTALADGICNQTLQPSTDGGLTANRSLTTPQDPDCLPSKTTQNSNFLFGGTANAPTRDPFTPQNPSYATGYAGYPGTAPNQAQTSYTQVTRFTPIMISGDDVFATGDANINQTAHEKLDQIAQLLMINTRYAPFDVIGHSDVRGSAEANQVLSEKRAQAVANYLYARGVTFGHLNVLGAGETQPLDTSTSPEAHKRNRRVEIRSAAGMQAQPSPPLATTPPHNSYTPQTVPTYTANPYASSSYNPSNYNQPSHSTSPYNTQPMPYYPSIPSLPYTN